MNKVRFIRLTAALVIFSAPAFAFSGGGEYPNKDMIQLQTQVQQLLDAVARLQQSNDERMGVLKDLVQQNSDSVNRMSVTIDALQKQITANSAANGGKIDTVTGQIQSLNDSLDEIKARMNRLEKVVNEVSSQNQTIIPIIQSLPQGASGSAPGSAPAPGTTTPPAALAAPPAPNTMADASAIPATPPGRRSSPATGAPPVDDVYKAALNDYMAARYSVALSEFSDITKTYPDSTLAGNAFYYMGEIDYRAARYKNAAADYDKLLEQYPDNNKIPAAHLHKGQALLELKQTEAGVRELRALIQRFPASPEATQARSKLNAMGIPIKPRS